MRVSSKFQWNNIIAFGIIAVLPCLETRSYTSEDKSLVNEKD